MKQVIVLSTFLIFFSINLFSNSTNVLSDIHAAHKGFSIDIAAGMEYKNGNTDYLRITPSLKTIYKKNPNKVIYFIGSYGFERANGENVYEEILFHARWRDSLIRRWIDFEIYSEYEKNDNKRLDIRLLGGVGLRFNLLRPRDTFNIIGISLGTLGLFEYEKLRSDSLSESGDRNYYARFESYVDVIFPIFEEKKSKYSNNRRGFYFYLSTNVNYMPLFDNFGHYRIVNNNSIDLGYGNRFKLRAINLRFDYDNQPATGVRSLDKSINSEISLSF